MAAENFHFRVLHGGRSVDIDAQASWNVLFVRQLVCQKLGLSNAASLRLVYAGQALGDSLSLSEVRPEEGTVLHLVLAATSDDQESLGRPEERQWRRFYVFCSACERLQRARLRLKCSVCGTGGVLLSSPLASFSALRSHDLRGVCANCEGRERPLTFELRCADSPEHPCVPLAMVRDNWGDGRECVVCFERHSPILAFACGHAVCLECFKGFAAARIAGGFRLHPRLGFTLMCPAWSEACGPDAGVEEPHHFLLLGRDFYSQVKAQGAEQHVAQTGGGFCPNPRCGDAWMPPVGPGGAGEDAAVRLRCARCEWEICGQCRERFHEGRACSGPGRYPRFGAFSEGGVGTGGVEKRAEIICACCLCLRFAAERRSSMNVAESTSGPRAAKGAMNAPAQSPKVFYLAAQNSSLF